MMSMSIKMQIILCLMFTLALGAGSHAGNKVAGDEIVSGTGTIAHMNIEGGFYGILADDGRKFLPRNLAPEFNRDGLRVKFQVKVLTNVVSIQMWGRPAQVLSMEILK